MTNGSPQVVFDSDRWFARVEHVHRTVAASGKRLRVILPTSLTQPWAGRFAESSEVGVGLERPAEGERCPETALLLSSGQAHRAQALETSATLMTVAHYRHAQLVSRSHVGSESTGLLIELALGPTQAGCRPGRDAVQLAEGIQALHGACFAGLCASIESLTSVERQTALATLSQTVARLRREQIEVGTVSVEDDALDLETLTARDITEIRVRNATLSGQPPVVTIRARVLSRPTIDTLSTNVGCIDLPYGCDAQLLDEPDAERLAMDSARSLWRVRQAARLLQISDPIVLTVTRPYDLLQTARDLTITGGENLSG